jgi:hypothetical protein
MVSRFRLLALVCLTSAAACTDDGGDVDGGVAQSFIALDHDFAGFQSWYSVDLPLSVLSEAVDPKGARFGFLNRRPPAGTTHYPVGTILVKAIKPSDDPATWEIFGVAKRGDDFNVDGATGWEFFLLRMARNGEPYITSRGLAPRDDGFDGGSSSYSPGGAAGGCNLCHGQPTYAASDHVIATALAPTATAN